MKFRKLLLNLTPTIIIPVGLVSSLVSCGNSTLPKVSSHKVINSLLNVLEKDSKGNLYYTTSDCGTVEVHQFNGSQVPYIDVDDYVNTLMQFEDIFGDETANYKSNTKDYKTVIVNTNNNSKATIDYEKQTISFDDYDMFGCEEKAYAKNPLAVGAGGGEKYYAKDGQSVLWDSKYVSGGTYTIDLKKYNIKAYYDKGCGYLPYDLYRNILNRNVLAAMFFNGRHFYQVSTSNSTQTIDLYKSIREETTILTKEYMEFSYNLLALTLDTRFGLYERLGRSDENKGKTIKYFPNGAYEALEPYKESLLSLDPDIANDAMCHVFEDLADDGGHAGYSGLDLLCTRPHKAARGYEKTHTFDTMDMINNARESIKSVDLVAPSDYWGQYFYSTTYDNYIKLYKQTDDNNPILYITFDAFNSCSKATTVEELIEGKARYEDVKIDLDDPTNSNYMLDTIRMTMGANKFINEYNTGKEGSKKINNIVLDLSNNGGGTVYTEHVLASWLCGGVREKVWNPHTKAYAEYSIYADLDGNGAFEKDKDSLSKDINVYCITSDTSFSCGNMLPCNLADNRSRNNTFFIGSPSGGGACFVDGNMHIGLGNVFRSSSNYHMLRKASTQENPISVESGHLSSTTEFAYYIPSTWDDAYKFVDRATINNKIWSL